MKENKQNVTTVNGVPLTDEMLETLKSWNLGSSVGYAAGFIETLRELQDFFCENLYLLESADKYEGSDVKVYVEFIKQIMFMKSEFEVFSKPIKSKE